MSRPKEGNYCCLERCVLLVLKCSCRQVHDASMVQKESREKLSIWVPSVLYDLYVWQFCSNSFCPTLYFHSFTLPSVYVSYVIPSCMSAQFHSSTPLPIKPILFIFVTIGDCGSFPWCLVPVIQGTVFNLLYRVHEQKKNKLLTIIGWSVRLGASHA